VAAPEQKTIMNLLLATSFALIFFFGLLAIALSLIEERTRKAMNIQSKLQKQKIFEISILKEIQDRIGYSLDVEQVIDVVTGSLKHIFPYSTASSMVIKENKIIFKTNVEENINHSFVQNVKASMIASLKALLPTAPTIVDEIISGLPLDDTNFSPLSSFFHIPLVVNNRVVGLINISSTKPNLYKEDEMTILYQITAQAASALTRLQLVLETEKGKLTSLISSLADGVFMLDNEKKVLIINDFAKRFLKLQTNEPSFFDILSAFPKEYDLVGKIEKISLSHLPVEEKEVDIGTNSFQVFITPVISSENQVIGVSILLHDITLEKNVAKVKEDFTNMMVHELRAPLSAIKDSADLMLEEKISDDDKRQLLKVINSQSKTLLSQISDVLDASKIEAGRFTINLTQNDLGALIKEVLKIFAPIAEKKGITISSKISPLPPVFLDRVRITQVLNNLISNSLKFTPSGGKIKVEASTLGNFARISVSDTGIGIPLEKQKDLFSKFYQAGEHQGGTGLGLFLVKGVVEAHKGNVSLESEENKGTTISFTLPIANQSSAIPNYRTLN